MTEASDLFLHDKNNLLSNTSNEDNNYSTEHKLKNQYSSFNLIKLYVREIIKELYLKNGGQGILSNSEYVDHMADMFAQVLVNKDQDATFVALNESVDIFENDQDYMNKYIKNILQNVENQASKIFKDIEKGKKELAIISKELSNSKKEIAEKKIEFDKLITKNQVLSMANWETSVKNEAIEEKLTNFEKLFDYFGEGCIEINANGKINMLNSALSNILGYSEDELNKQELISLTFDYNEANKLAQLLGDNFLNREIGVRQIAFKHKNDSKIWIQFKLKKLANEKSVIFLSDITGFTEAINFPMKNPHIVCAFNPNSDLKEVKLDGYNDIIFPGFRKILNDLNETDPNILFPPNLKLIVAKTVNFPGILEKEILEYKNKKGKKFFSWKFRYDNQENIVQAYAEDITQEERMRQENENIQENTLFQMARMEEVVSKDIGPHIQTVYKITTKFVNKLMEIGRTFDLDSKQTGYAAILHDIGKVYIPENVLNKPGMFNSEEKEIMNYHTILGADIINRISDSLMHQVATDIAYYHHQWWDGNEEKSYPKPGAECKGDDIPLEARIVAIVDVFDALLSKRCYKDEKDINDVKIILNKGKGSQFDPKLLDVFMDNFDEFITDRKNIIDDYEKKQQKTLLEEAKNAREKIEKFKNKDRDEWIKRENIVKRTD